MLMRRRSSASFSADGAKPPYGLSLGLVWHRTGPGLQRLRRLLPLTASGHSSRPTSSAATVLRYRCGPADAFRPIRRLSTAIEAASGGFEQPQEIKTMAQIGTFTRDETGAYNGTIKTLTLNVKASIKPCDRDNDRAPDFRVTATGVEFGAGWSRTARETGAEYLSLKLDDPSFTAPVYASLVQGDKGEHELIWSR